MRGLHFHSLSAVLTPDEGQPLPTEILFFNAGLNHTEKGSFVFDKAAAEAVMAEHKRRGVDLMIDLEHDSLSVEAKLLRSDAADARGWFGLEVRPDGSLWAVNVTWAADGEARLRDKRQRYISPAFTTTKDEHGVLRPSRVINAAICARPATFETPALVAASAGTLRARDAQATSTSTRQRALAYTLQQKHKRLYGSR